jgi:fatty acid desaturase
MHTAEPITDLERSEEALSWAGLAVAETLRVAELAAVALVALLVCPPLLILLVIVVVPIVALAAIAALIASVIALPVFIVRHFHRHSAAHSHQRVRRLAELGRTRTATATSRVHRGVAGTLAKLGAPKSPPC